MEQNRREFLKTAMVSAGCLTLGEGCFDSCAQQIANRPTRKDINTLAANDPIIQAYKAAVTQMKALPSSSNLNWINQSNIHGNFCPHSNWFFLPWHRWYLTFFERICQQLTGMQDFALPYWNWVKDPTVPAVFWGDSSNPLYDANRAITPGQVIDPSIVGCNVVGPIMNDTDFITFASDSITLSQDQRTMAGYGALEATPHNGVHGAVGGDMGVVAISPHDPIFWLHHCMIEKCWVEWNFVRNNPNTDDINWTSRQFGEFYDQNGNPVPATSAEVGIGLLLPILSYQFDNLPVIPASCGGSNGPERRAGWEKFNNIKTRANQDAQKAVARSGATVRLDVVRRFGLDRPASIDIGKTASLPITADLAALRAAPAAGQRVLLRFNSVSLNHTTDFFVKVFIGKPDATAATPDTDPHFVGGFAFFQHPHGHEHGGQESPALGNYHLDATTTVQRLGLEGQAVDVNVVLAPYPNRQPQTSTLDIAATEIYIVKDVIERHPK